MYNASEVSRLLGLPLPQGPAPGSVEGFITFFDPGLSILDLRAVVASKGNTFCPQDWYDNEPFTHRDEAPRYRQVRLRPFPDSFRKTFAEQQLLVPDGEEVPSARVMVTALVVQFLATGQRLLESCSVHTADVCPDGGRVYGGSSGRGGLYVLSRWDDIRDCNIGLASSRKF